ncbi:hypothetical protein DFH27DRAFT_520780 [Peziza echinospora]|nr:hypothetical protein DFH27DRAFT_520780 [Peziza echinospora]
MPIIDGIKYACEPCMRGHRSSKCAHEDRLLVRVRKPGRPLSACPHQLGPVGTTTFVDANGARLEDNKPPTKVHPKGCGCEIASLAIPKVSTCACSHHAAAANSEGSEGSEKLILAPQNPKPTANAPLSQVPLSLYNNNEAGRISKNNRKRKSVSISGEAILQFAAKQENNDGSNTQIREWIEPVVGVNPQSFNPHGQLKTLDLNKRFGHVQKQGNQRASRQAADSQYQDEDNSQWMDPSLWQRPIDAMFSQGPNHQNSGEHQLSAREMAQAALQAAAQAQAFTEAQTHVTSSSGLSIASAQPAVPLEQAFTMLPLDYTQQQNTIVVDSQAPQYPVFPHPLQSMEPIVTTVYTYPNGFTTINSPLTEEELMMMQNTNASSNTPIEPFIDATENNKDKNMEFICNCGPGCSCLGCAAHPYNASTVNFVKDMSYMMVQQRERNTKSIQVPSEPSESTGAPKVAGCCGTQNLVSNSAKVPNYITYQDGEQLDSAIVFMPQTPSLGLRQNSRPPDSPMSHMSYSPDDTFDNLALSRPHHCRPTAPLPTTPGHASEASPNVGTSEDDMESEQRVVSPSAYFHVHYPMGSCGMECLCGDNCTCIGCLIHNNDFPNVSFSDFEEMDEDGDEIVQDHNSNLGSNDGVANGNPTNGQNTNLSGMVINGQSNDVQYNWNRS